MNLFKAMVELFNHNDKSKKVSFEIIFNGSQKAAVGKAWKDGWVYYISEAYCPTIVYTEEQILLAVACIEGIGLKGNKICFEISETRYTN